MEFGQVTGRRGSHFKRLLLFPVHCFWTSAMISTSWIVIGSGSHEDMEQISSREGNFCGKSGKPSAKRIESSASKELEGRNNLHHVA